MRGRPTAADRGREEERLVRPDDFTPEEFAGFGEQGEYPEWRAGSISPLPIRRGDQID